MSAASSRGSGRQQSLSPSRRSSGGGGGGGGGGGSGTFFAGSSTWGGSSSLGSLPHASSTSVPSPLTYNSPTKRFGYTRYPPLLKSPSSMEGGGGLNGSGAGSSHHHQQLQQHQHNRSFHSSHYSFEDDDYADVRLEVEQVGHNLTSVMMDPRAPGGVSAELELAWQEQAHTPSSSSSHSSSTGGGHAGGHGSVVIPSVETADLREMARRMGPVVERYRQNHHATPGQTKLYRPELLSSSQKATDGAADLAECFRQVPGFFFHKDFHLTDPAMFETLVVKATPETQEKLSQYLDVVETCLLKQISSRSQHFFEALTTLQDVRDRVAQACRQVLRLRAGLHDIDRKTVMGMIRIPRLAQRKVNLAMLLEKMRLIQDVQRSKELVQSLLSAGDYMGALDVLEDGRTLMREGGLASVHCMRKLDRQLGEYLELVSDLMGSSFINLAVQFQDESFDPASSSTILMEAQEEWAPSSSSGHRHTHTQDEIQPPQPQQLREALAAQLVPRVRGLVRLCRLSKVLERYRGRLTDTLKGVVKTVLLEYLEMADYQREGMEEGDGPLGEGSGVALAAAAGRRGSGSGNGGGEGGDPTAPLLTSKVKTMEPGAFLDCLRLCFEQMLLPMERVGLIHAFLEEQISVELSRLLDRRTSFSMSSQRQQQQQQQEKASSGSLAEEGSPAGAGDGQQQQQPEGSSTGMVPSPKQQPPQVPASPSTKFKAFLDKRRMETGGGGSSGPGGAGGAGSGSVGGGASNKTKFKDEDQIKVLELQACKRLNDEVLKTLCDLCQRHIASLLVTRKEAHARLTLVEMKTLWDTTTYFVASMERISGTAGFGLKSTLLTQAKLFVEHMHEDYMAQLLAGLDCERWVQSDVSAERQAEIDRLTAGKAILAHRTFHQDQSNSNDPAAAAAHGTGEETDVSTSTSNSKEGGGGAASAGSEAGPAANGGGLKSRKKEPTEAVVADGRYKVVWSAILLVSMLTNYLNVAANFPTLTMDVMQRVVDLLRLFNARTAQLVLGAGAIQAAARLRSITAKHLALASQCLSLVLVLLPHVRAALAAHLQSKQQAFLVELDRIRQEYAEHHEKILAKFVAIIGELVAQSAANTGLRETDWDAMGSSACRFVEEVIKGVSTMHKVLQQLLPPPQVQDVFSRVVDLLAHRLREYLEDAKPVTTAGRQRLVDEVSHLVTSISMLRGVDANALSVVETALKDKHLVKGGGGGGGAVAAASSPSS